MSEQHFDIEKLIRLKRYEKPSDGYFDNFLAEFQRRQRSELLQHSARSLFFERVSTYFSDISKRQWIYGGSAAYAVLTVGFFLVSGFAKNHYAQSPTATLSTLVATEAPAALAATDDAEFSLWDERRIVIVADDPIVESHGQLQMQMSSNPEYDLSILRTGTSGSSASYVPVGYREGSPEAKPLPRPAGLDL